MSETKTFSTVDEAIDDLYENPRRVTFHSLTNTYNNSLYWAVRKLVDMRLWEQKERKEDHVNNYYTSTYGPIA